MARLLKGAPLAHEFTQELARRTERLCAHGVVPTLALVRVGERADDLSYERAAVKRAASVGVKIVPHQIPAGADHTELEAVVERLNTDQLVHGVLVFRPLPEGFDDHLVGCMLDPAKDVDGMTEGSLLATFTGAGRGFPPCTAEAVVELLDRSGVELDGARVTVVGRSLVIGRPVAMMLLARNATVTMCHTHTRDLAASCAAADVIVVAAGSPGTIRACDVSPGQVVVDVGVTWDAETGSFVGDVAFDEVEPIVDAITPVPGGVGSMTTTILMKHVVEAAERTAAKGGLPYGDR